MKRPRKKIILVTITVLLISMFLATTVYAAWTEKNIKAHYRNVKIYHNGKEIKIDKAYEPFIVHVNGDPKKAITFVPLRALGEILGKEVKWTQKDYRVDINDKEEQVDQAEFSKLQIELISKNIEIDNLKKQVADLETKLKEAEKKQDQKKNLSDLEKELNKKYGYYERMDFDIRLTEYKGDIDVNIVVDLDRDYSRWNSLRDRDIEYYIEDIVKEIRYDFKDAKIYGEIEDKRTRDKLVDFYTDNRDRVVISSKGSSSGYIRDIKDMEDYLNDRSSTYEGARFRIYLNENKNKDTIEIVLDVYKKDWDSLGIKGQDDYLEKLYYEINREFPKMYVEGTVFDGSQKLNSFDFDSSGKLSVW